MTQQQYQVYPYPPRDPQDELKENGLLIPIGDSLEEIAHFLFQGTLPNPFRVLIAGGGTGDNVVYLAEQLRGNENAEIVYLDLCLESMKIAQARAEIRGLKDRITWIHSSIYNLVPLKQFHHIICTGVLHHLEDPEKALKILAGCLKPNGGMHLMVYAQYGRTAIYQIQELLRMMLPPSLTPSERLSRARNILEELPPTNWLWHPQHETLFGKLEDMHDSEFYDLFLNERDRAYTVPEVKGLVASCPDLHWVDFSEPATRVLLGKTDPALEELRHGTVIKHAFFVSKQVQSAAQVSNPDQIPFLFRVKNIDALLQAIAESPSGTVLEFSLKATSGMSISLPIQNPATHAILSMLRDGKGDQLHDHFPLRVIQKTLQPLIEGGLVLLRKA